jgi:hypothetical protein
MAEPNHHVIVEYEHDTALGGDCALLRLRSNPSEPFLIPKDEIRPVVTALLQLAFELEETEGRVPLGRNNPQARQT